MTLAGPATERKFKARGRRHTKIDGYRYNISRMSGTPGFRDFCGEWHQYGSTHTCYTHRRTREARGEVIGAGASTAIPGHSPPGRLGRCSFSIRYLQYPCVVIKWCQWKVLGSRHSGNPMTLCRDPSTFHWHHLITTQGYCRYLIEKLHLPSLPGGEWPGIAVLAPAPITSPRASRVRL